MRIYKDLNLNEREKLILRCIVHNFILTVNPVGSRVLARRYALGLSPASVRNTMADLEEMGLLTHPHTSAGRIPTDFGYRIYVDYIMQAEELTDDDRQSIDHAIKPISAEVDSILEKVTELLSEVSRLLSVITAPDLSSGILDKIEMVRVSSERIMLIVVVKSGMVRTINLEMKSIISDAEITYTSRFINQRLSGLRLTEIPALIEQRLSGDKISRNAIVRLFLDFPEKIFTYEPIHDMHISGTRLVLDQPEYRTPEKLKGIIELIEDRNVVVHLLKDRSPGVTVTIGDENTGEQLKDFSVITSTYRIGDHQGTLGIIGPTRMNYSKLVSLVDYTSRLVSERAKEK